MSTTRSQFGEKEGLNLSSRCPAVTLAVAAARPLRIQYSGVIYPAMNRGGSRNENLLRKRVKEYLDLFSQSASKRARFP
jgi:hypothetical protein